MGGAIKGNCIYTKHWFESGNCEVLYCRELPDGNYALFDSNGKQRGVSFYGYCQRYFSSGLWPVKLEKDGLWGFLDTSGELVIEPKFSEEQLFRGFHSDRLLLNDGRVFNKVGDEVIDLSKRYVRWESNFVNGRLPVATRTIRKGELWEHDEAWGYIDIHGNEIIPCQYHRVSHFVCGRATVQKTRWQRINGNGELAKYKGKYRCSLSGQERYGVIDDEGEVIIPFEYEGISYYGGQPDSDRDSVKLKEPAQALFIVDECGKNGKSGMMDGNGEWIVEPQFDKTVSGKWFIATGSHAEFWKRKCIFIRNTYSADKSKRKFGAWSLDKGWLIEPIKCAGHEIEQMLIDSYAFPSLSRYEAIVNMNGVKKEACEHCGWRGCKVCQGGKIIPGSRRKIKRNFDSFAKAYMWCKKRLRGIQKTLYEKYGRDGESESKFCVERLIGDFVITGEKSEQKQQEESTLLCAEHVDREAYLKSDAKFDPDDYKWVEWCYRMDGALTHRSYKGYSRLWYDYLPSDEAEDAGTHFKTGDIVKWNRCGEDIVGIICSAPGKKENNRWENIYSTLTVNENNGRNYVPHDHIHEKDLASYEGEIDKNSPLWFIHQAYSGRLNLTEKQVYDIWEGELLRSGLKSGWQIIPYDEIKK